MKTLTYATTTLTITAIDLWIEEMVKPVWNHRIMLRTEAHINDIKAEDILDQIMRKISLPDERVVRQ